MPADFNHCRQNPETFAAVGPINGVMRLYFPGNTACIAAFTAAALMMNDATPAKTAEPMDKVEGRFRAMFEGRCATADPDGRTEYQSPETHEIRFKHKYQSDDTEQVVTLYVMLCDLGAYNETHVFMLADEYGEIRPLQFAEPALKITYENDDNEAAIKHHKD